MVVWQFIALGVVVVLAGVVVLLLPRLVYKLDNFPFVPVGEPALTRAGAEAYMGKGAATMAFGFILIFFGLFANP